MLFARDPDRPLIPGLEPEGADGGGGAAHVRPDASLQRRRCSPTRAPDAQGGGDGCYVRGGGDPALTSEDLWRLAADAARAGVRRVRGGLVLDDAAFDAERWNPSWGAVSARAYHAPIGALTVNYGALGVTLIPGGAPGEPVRVMVDPPVPFFRVTNRATHRRERARRLSLEVERRAGDGGENAGRRGWRPPAVRRRPSSAACSIRPGYLGAVCCAAARGQRRARRRASWRPAPRPPEAAPLLAFAGRAARRDRRGSSSSTATTRSARGW